MSLPVYLQGPPLGLADLIDQLALEAGKPFRVAGGCGEEALIRVSAATRPTNSSTTAVMAGLPPSRS